MQRNSVQQIYNQLNGQRCVRMPNPSELDSVCVYARMESVVSTVANLKQEKKTDEKHISYHIFIPFGCFSVCVSAAIFNFNWLRIIFNAKFSKCICDVRLFVVMKQWLVVHPLFIISVFSVFHCDLIDLFSKINRNIELHVASESFPSAVHNRRFATVFERTFIHLNCEEKKSDELQLVALKNKCENDWCKSADIDMIITKLLQQKVILSWCCYTNWRAFETRWIISLFTRTIINHLHFGRGFRPLGNSIGGFTFVLSFPYCVIRDWIQGLRNRQISISRKRWSTISFNCC